jgi:hypothetical protein
MTCGVGRALPFSDHGVAYRPAGEAARHHRALYSDQLFREDLAAHQSISVVPKEKPFGPRRFSQLMPAIEHRLPRRLPSAQSEFGLSPILVSAQFYLPFNLICEP